MIILRPGHSPSSEKPIFDPTFVDDHGITLATHPCHHHPLFLDQRLTLYVLAARNGWEEGAKFTSRHTLGLSIHDKQHLPILDHIRSPICIISRMCRLSAYLVRIIENVVINFSDWSYSALDILALTKHTPIVVFLTRMAILVIWRNTWSWAQMWSLRVPRSIGKKNRTLVPCSAVALFTFPKLTLIRQPLT